MSFITDGASKLFKEFTTPFSKTLDPIGNALGFGKKDDAPGAPGASAAPSSIADMGTPAVQAAAEAERRRQRNAAGRAATMLTGGAGEAISGSAIGTTKLLGGG